MRVSVVIPCHNVEQHVAAALASVLDQQHADLDVVCVDDGSTDGTSALLQRLLAMHAGRFRVITTPNHGASAARNLGMRETTGVYIQFLDADDTIAPNKISAQIALASARSLPDLIIGDFEQLMPNGLLLPMQAQTGNAWMALIRTRMGTTSANLWKRSAVEQAGGWNEQWASSQDYEFMFRMLQANARVEWDPVVRTQVLKRASGSISQTGVRANWDRYIALRQAIKEHLRASDAQRYAAEIETLRQYIFMALRIVAAEDLPKAVSEYARCVGPRFRPQVSRAITERYALLHNLLGFATTERLLRLVKGSRSTPTTA